MWNMLDEHLPAILWTLGAVCGAIAVGLSTGDIIAPLAVIGAWFAITAIVCFALRN